MKINKTLSFGLLFLLTLSGCERTDEKQEDLLGVTYRNISEVPQFNGFSETGGSIIEVKSPNGDEFAISQLSNERNYIMILEKIIRTSDDQKVKYQILDTIFIERISGEEYIYYCNFRNDSINDPEIIAMVVADPNKEFYDKIIKAWRADTKTGKIVLLNDHSRINCFNEGYGLDACGEDEDMDESDSANVMIESD